MRSSIKKLINVTFYWIKKDDQSWNEEEIQFQREKKGSSRMMVKECQYDSSAQKVQHNRKLQDDD